MLTTSESLQPYIQQQRTQISQLLSSNSRYYDLLLYELRQKNLIDKNFTLRISIQCQDDQNFIFDYLELSSVLSIFGEVNSMHPQQAGVVISYQSMLSTYFAKKCLNKKPLILNSHLRVDWGAPIEPMCVMLPAVKHTCRYEIQITDSKSFKVSRKVIGPQGSNMKKIIKACGVKQGKAHDIIKIRLRGKGSGFREGPQKAESDEPLHICISSKFKEKFDTACRLLEQLLTKVYRDYDEFCLEKGKEPPRLQVKKLEATQTKNNMITMEELKSYEIMENLPLEEIQNLVNIRNEARRVCNYQEADYIRWILREKGVALIDEKGARGVAPQVTTWKYLQQREQHN